MLVRTCDRCEKIETAKGPGHEVPFRHSDLCTKCFDERVDFVRGVDQISVELKNALYQRWLDQRDIVSLNSKEQRLLAIEIVAEVLTNGKLANGSE